MVYITTFVEMGQVPHRKVTKILHKVKNLLELSLHHVKIPMTKNTEQILWKRM